MSPNLPHSWSQEEALNRRKGRAGYVGGDDGEKEKKPSLLQDGAPGAQNVAQVSDTRVQSYTTRWRYSAVTNLNNHTVGGVCGGGGD